MRKEEKGPYLEMWVKSEDEQITLLSKHFTILSILYRSRKEKYESFYVVNVN